MRSKKSRGRASRRRCARRARGDMVESGGVEVRKEEGEKSETKSVVKDTRERQWSFEEMDRRGW